MQRWKLAGGMAALIAAGVLGSALPGSAQKNKGKVDSTVGYVDLGQVTEQIKQTQTWQTMVANFETQKTKFREELSTLNKVRYLTAAERTELQNLRGKKTATDAEKGRINELEAKSAKLEQEFQAMATVERPSEEQKKRLQDLTKLREDGINALQEETDRRTQELQKLEGQLLEQMQGNILKVVEQVADQRNLTLVVDRQAILYGGQDLTTEVVKKLGTK